MRRRISSGRWRSGQGRSAQVRTTYLWEDGHAWHLYVEESDGHRTYVFSRWVQFGTLDVHVISPGDSTLAIQHDSANAFALYCAEYLGPGRVRSTELAGYTPSAQHFTWAD